MALNFDRRRLVRGAAGPMVAAAVIAYFGLSAFQGDRGVLRVIQLRQEIVRAEVTLARANADKTSLERRVAALKSSALDRDLLDERARVMTGLMGADDIVITGAMDETRSRRTLSVIGTLPVSTR